MGTDALYVLAQDHRLVEKLFKRAQSDVMAFEPLREELDLHARVEEEIFYPAVEAALGDEGEGIVEEARREHLEVKDLLTELSGLERGSEEFEEKLRTLQKTVGRHVVEEEGEMFKRALRAISWERLGELGVEMKARKEDLRTGLAQP